MPLNESANIFVSEGAQNRDADLNLVIDKNLFLGASEIVSKFGSLDSLERDLLVLAGSVYCSDLAVKRADREKFQRTISISIPLVHKDLFDRFIDQIIDALWVVTRDNWQITIRQSDKRRKDPFSPGTPGEISGATLLFSGGLDSLAAAYKFLSEGQKLHLVSHVTSNATTKRAQEQLFGGLKSLFPSDVERTAVHLFARNFQGVTFPTEREETQRARSFLFLIAGAVIARRLSQHRLFMIAENGQMAIHLPLSAARIGAFSTYTAHPEYIKKMSKLLSEVLNFSLTIVNPFLYSTKAEVVSQLLKTGPGLDLAKKSVSCWRGSRVSGSYDHCGDCVPCLVRRISIEANGSTLQEYASDLLKQDVPNLPEEHIGKRNLVDLIEFARWFRPEVSDQELLEQFPDLTSSYFDVKKIITLHRRISLEAYKVFKRYPKVFTLC